jgi:hypothetical protein
MFLARGGRRQIRKLVVYVSRVLVNRIVFLPLRPASGNAAAQFEEPVVCSEVSSLLHRAQPVSIGTLATARWTWAQRGYIG